MTVNDIPASGRRPPRRVLVIEHEPGCPLDRFANWMDGIAVEVVRPYAGDVVPASALDGLIVLGGRMSAYDDQVAPWLPAVRELLAASVAARVPTLGICLGAQLLAVACGGSVELAARPGRECGVIDIVWRSEAGSDPLVSEMPDRSAAPSMHADAVVELPAGSVWLASSDMYSHQVFRVGAAAWGVQFHPEVSLPTFRGWASGVRELEDAHVQTLATEFLVRERDVVEAGRGLAGRFAALVDDAAVTSAAAYESA